MRLGIANQETWSFFQEIYTSLTQRYETSLFRRRTWSLPILQDRLNRYLFHHDLQTFLQVNDIVFFEWASELLAVATHLPKTCGIVTRLHRYEMYEWINRINWEVVDKIIVVSQAKKRELIAQFPQQTAKIVVAAPSTSLDKFTPKPKPFAGDIGILCHLTPRKRVYDLILAFYELNQKSADWHLHIAGSPVPAHVDYAAALHDLVDKLNLQNKVTFYGQVDDAWNWYHKIDIFISNSYSEGLQVAPMEAMASGCYCLVHHWSGAEDMLPPENLFYTSTQLQEKLIRYADLREEEKNRRKAHMRALACEKFDIRHTAAQIIQTIEEVAVVRGATRSRER